MTAQIHLLLLAALQISTAALDLSSAAHQSYASAHSTQSSSESLDLGALYSSVGLKHSAHIFNTALLQSSS
jgi:hypothetical protein